ncbi:MAG: UDP-3-O-acylglucosamine N-acyltransferase [Micavibrio sp.]|nr:MAG: UDP-3-O-acylglucosamine N-acyltransferase [Micavibrio sp.]
MPDERFFKRHSAFSVGQLAEMTGCETVPGTDNEYMLEDVMPLDKAGSTDLSFFDNIKYKDQFLATKAGACFVDPQFADKKAPEGVHLLLTSRPYKSYALAAQAFYPDAHPAESVADTAVINSEAKIGAGCVIEAGAVIAAGAEIGDRCWIEANATIGENVIIGSHCRIGAGAAVSHALIEDHVRLYTGVRVGQDGFGFAIDPHGHVKVPQLGRVLIGSHVEIGANTCIDRGSGPDTVIGAGTWIDNLVQIGHNAQIGMGCVIVSQVGISGSAVIEDFVALGGQSGVAGHLRVGQGAKISAQAGVMRDVPPGEEQAGTPAMPSKQVIRQIIALGKLVDKKKAS